MICSFNGVTNVGITNHSLIRNSGSLHYIVSTSGSGGQEPEIDIDLDLKIYYHSAKRT